MERVATDVAKPPVASGELPSFEELLAKGSFHARLAQARLKRERALAESGDADGFILDTTRKPWEREAERAERRDPLTTALGNSIAVEGAAPAPTPAPSPAAARRGMGTAARPAARPGGGGLSAKIVPIRQGNVLWLDYPVAAEDRAAAVAALLPRHDDLVPDRVPPAVAPTVAPAIQPDQVAPAVAPAIEPVIVNAPESVTEAELAGLVERLGAAGFALAEPNRVDIPISESNVRFFHSEDAAAAQAVATRLGARLRDFTSFAPSPPAGTIEVWLSGRGNAAAPAKTRRASGQRAVTAEERELNLLRDRILQQLRNGEHL